MKFFIIFFYFYFFLFLLSKYHDKDVLIATLVQSCTGKRPSFCACLPFNTAIIKEKSIYYFNLVGLD